MLSGVVYAGAFSSWMLLPTFAGYALGFVLWGLSGAMMSGTFEALLYDELTDRGVEEQYARLIGWAQSTAMVAVLVSSVAAAPLFALGGYGLVGWSSVALAGVHTVLAATLPVSMNARRPNTAHHVFEETERLTARYLSMLRSGLGEASTAVDVRRIVVIGAVLFGLSAYDEYFPLVARDHDVSTQTVPILVGITVVGGGRSAPPWPVGPRRCRRARSARRSCSAAC